MRIFLQRALGLLLLGAGVSGTATAQAINENFDNVPGLFTSGWSQKNNSSPLGASTWVQGSTATFPSFNGAGTSYIAVNFNSTTGTGTINQWLFTPVRDIKNDDSVIFYTRIPAGTVYPDRLELRLSTAGASTDVGTTATSVGDFSILVTSVNPNLSSSTTYPAGYPNVWTRIGAKVTGLAGPVSGRFAFRYHVTNGGPNGANSNYIGVDAFQFKPFVSGCPAVTIATPASTNLCPGTPLLLSASAATGNPSFQWFLNNNPIAGATSDAYIVTAGGAYTVRATYGAPQSCVSTSNLVTINTIPKPTANFSFDSYCVGRATMFSNTTTVTPATTPVAYRWNFGAGGRDTVIAGNTSFTYGTTGARQVKLVAIPNGCLAQADSITKTITLETPPAGMRLPTVNVKYDTPTELMARTLPGAALEWNPPVMISSATIVNPTVRAVREQDYRIFYRYASGCETVDSLLVRIFTENNIFVPTAFSPNGDGQNDRLRPLLVGITNFRTFRVYNRLGQELFSTGDAMTTGWDGTYKGQALPADTYMWVTEGYDRNGNFIRRNGQVVLVR
ncbi:choice-of-anchor J domain-containing protein [Flaviaesturariibacter amylovorans]|uniref:PKD domain-containing protein n=1 Tax=Flaviaesturariibacter amylovorans TaxID=1084520 RepID=A0ABP8HK07_9BACT